MGSDDIDSLLTETHREFLEGAVEFDWNDSKGRTTRTRIRQRVLAGLGDFMYLADPERFLDRDVEQIREESITDQLVELIAFVYRVAPDSFTEIVEAGTRRGIERVDPEYELGEVQIPIQKSGRLLKQARQRMEDNDPLPDREIRVLLEHGEMPAEEIREYVQAHPSPDTEHLYRFR